jgi:hypothetical protein
MTKSMSGNAPLPDRQLSSAGRDQVHVNLLGLGQRLREHAASLGLSVGCAVRISVSQMLEEAAAAAESGAHQPAAQQGEGEQGDKARLLLRVAPTRIEVLAARARACGVSRSRYVEMLMDGCQPTALPPDHKAMVDALMTATDHIAVLCVDLRAFMRLCESAPASELERYRARLSSLIDDVRDYLKPAARLLAELEATRRWR